MCGLVGKNYLKAKSLREQLSYKFNHLLLFNGARFVLVKIIKYLIEAIICKAVLLTKLIDDEFSGLFFIKRAVAIIIIFVPHLINNSLHSSFLFLFLLFLRCFVFMFTVLIFYFQWFLTVLSASWPKVWIFTILCWLYNP